MIECNYMPSITLCSVSNIKLGNLDCFRVAKIVRIDQIKTTCYLNNVHAEEESDFAFPFCLVYFDRIECIRDLCTHYLVKTGASIPIYPYHTNLNLLTVWPHFNIYFSRLQWFKIFQNKKCDGIIECEDHLSYTGDLHEAIGSHHIYLY